MINIVIYSICLIGYSVIIFLYGKLYISEEDMKKYKTKRHLLFMKFMLLVCTVALVYELHSVGIVIK